MIHISETAQESMYIDHINLSLNVSPSFSPSLHFYVSKIRINYDYSVRCTLVDKKAFPTYMDQHFGRLTLVHAVCALSVAKF